MNDSDNTAHGWDAINRATQVVYGEQDPQHFGTLIKYCLGGPDPLDGISVFRNDGSAAGANGKPHWHYVTYGLSDLYGDQASDQAEQGEGAEQGAPKYSGYGFELTFRLPIAAGETTPPHWPMSFLQNVARYVFETGNTFAPGHWMTANGPIQTGADTLITEMGFVSDPQLATTITPYGEVQFLQVVGLTADELHEAKRWNVRGLLDALQPHMPLWVTNIARPSLHDLPDVQAAIAQGAATEGSSTGVLFGGELSLKSEKRLLRAEKITVTIGALLVRDLLNLLPGRYPHGKQLTAAGDEYAICFVPTASGCKLEWEDRHTLIIDLGERELQAWINTVKPVGGDYQVRGMDQLVWRVEPSIIRKSDGSVQEVFGAPASNS